MLNHETPPGVAFRVRCPLPLSRKLQITKMKLAPFSDDTFTGVKINGLTPIIKVGRGGRGAIWRCQCECGSFTTAFTAEIRSGQKKSCGCWNHKKGPKNKRWKGHGEIGSGYWGEVIFNAQSRKGRSIPFLITIEQAWNLFLKQERKCAISGLELKFNIDSTERTASLDRIESDKPYSIDNVWWVHKDINYMKMDLPMDRFMELVGKIYEYRNKLPR